MECPGKKEDLVGGRIHVFSAEPLAVCSTKVPKNGGDAAIGGSVKQTVQGSTSRLAGYVPVCSWLSIRYAIWCKLDNGLQRGICREMLFYRGRGHLH